MSDDPQLSSSPASLASSDVMRGVLLWRKKKQSAVILIVATVTWVVLQVYQFNFLTVASWVAMAFVASLFLLGNFLKLLGKEPPNTREWKISENLAEGVANSVKQCTEEGLWWMFRISAEREWIEFGGAVAALWLLSKVGSYFDLLSLAYAGTVMGMTVPVIYTRYEDKIKRYADGMRQQWRKFCKMVDEKVIQKMKHKLMADGKKEKKVE